MKYEWKEYGLGFVVSKTGPKCYGPVRLKSGRTIYRKYKHELKNGRGMSLLDLMQIRAMNDSLQRSIQLASRVFGAPTHLTH